MKTACKVRGVGARVLFLNVLKLPYFIEKKTTCNVLSFNSNIHSASGSAVECT